MKHVLIVDDDESFITSLQVGLEAYADKFSFHIAKNGIEALEILNKFPVATVVTDLKMPDMGGFELLLTISKKFPSISVIIMSAFGTADIKEQVEDLGALNFLDKPLSINELISAIKESGDDQSVIKGISLSGFLQLIEMEKKTCILEVKTGNNKKGHFFFEHGKMYDAAFEDLLGEEAAISLIASESKEIRIKNIKSRKKKQIRIDKSVMNILMKGMKLKDDKEDEKQESQNLLDEIDNNMMKSDRNKGEDDILTLKGIQNHLKENLYGLIIAFITDTKKGKPLVMLKTDAEFDTNIQMELYLETFRSAVKSFDIVGWGTPKEVLMPGNPNSVILVSLKKGEYYQGIVFNSETQLGMVQAVFNKVKPEIEKLL
jgi:CheY-like chemotaxis protein